MIFSCFNNFWAVFLFLIVPRSGSSFYLDFMDRNELISESQVTMTALHKALTYLHEHPRSLTDDVILGALMARANLEWIFTRPKSHVDLDYPLSEKLGSLIMICDNIIDSKKFNKTHILSMFNENVLKNEAEDLKYGILSQQDEYFVLPNFDSCQSIDEYFMRGTPEDSDFCIDELLRTYCNVSEYCWQSEVNPYPHSGYKTSHRLIYLQAATKLQCEKMNPDKFSTIGELKEKLCQQMLWESKALTKNPYFPVTRDLFMEHIALCGFEGYAEFASKPWRYQVRSWQSENDCFEFDERFNCSQNKISKNDSSPRIKRTDTVIDRCHTHVTAVAVSALAFFLRFLLNAAFSTS